MAENDVIVTQAGSGSAGVGTGAGLGNPPGPDERSSRTLWYPGRPQRSAPAQRSWVRVGFGLGVGLLLAYATAEALLESAQVLTLVLLALFLAVSLEPVVVSMTRRLHLRRGIAVMVVLSGFALILGGFIAVVIPPVTNEINALTKAIPKWLQEIHDHNSQLGRLEDRYHIVAKAQERLTSDGFASTVASGALVAGQLILGVVSAVVIVVTLTIYFLVGMPAVKDFGLRFARAGNRGKAEEITDKIVLQVGRYMLGNLATSALAGLATFIWAMAVGVPYAAMLGFLVAFLDMIPVFGSTVGGVVVSLVALAVSLPVALATAAFYIFFRFAEDHLITPLTMKFTVRVHPVATMIAVLVGGTLLGLIGALIAVPAAAAVGLILDETVFPGRDAAE